MAPPISIQSQKLIPWLIERNVIPKDYAKRLEEINKKIVECSKSDSQKLDALGEQSVQYFYALSALKYLEETDTTKDFFGRASASVRSWRDVVSRYESCHTNLAEISERLNDICFQIPKCKSSIADRQKLINDLQRKVQEFATNQHSKESELDRSRKRFGIQDEHTRLQLLVKATTLPDFLHNYVESLKNLQPALDFYTSFTSFINPQRCNSCGPVCSTLRLLIASGHTTVYQWKTGHVPTSIGASDDYLPKMLDEERKRIERFKAEAETTMDELDLGALEAEGETNREEIDFGGDLEIDVIDFSAIEDDKTDAISRFATASTSSASCKSTATVSGANARLLLDSTDGRNALINDLEELATFLLRIEENLFDFQSTGSNKNDTKKKANAGINLDVISPIYHQIMQDAPAEINVLSPENLSAMSSEVRKAFNEITDETINHLSLLRLQPSYLERLISGMHDLKRQADRAGTRVMEFTASLQQAEDELMTYQNEVVSCLMERKRLVSFLETELSKIYDREIKLIGAAISV